MKEPIVQKIKIFLISQTGFEKALPTEANEAMREVHGLVLGRKSGRQLPRSFADANEPLSGTDYSSAKKRRLTESSIGSSGPQNR